LLLAAIALLSKSMAGHDGESSAHPAPILAVDDHPANLFALSAILEPLGSALITADSGTQALELAAKGEFAVILLDVMMPGLDGFATLARLRAIPQAQSTPVVLLTAYELDTRAIERVRGMGTVDYILKPIAPELLRGKVAAYVSLYRRGKELARRDEALAAKDRDIAMLAHDLQNPLTAIITSAKAMLGRDLDARNRSTAERIARSGARMSEMIRSLTDYARAGRGAIPIAPSAMDIGDLCREVAEHFRSVDQATQIDLSCSGELVGTWDQHRLHQAITNLIGNALRYGGGRAVVQARAVGASVEVAVHNDGPPIPAGLLTVIFEPFERGADHGAGLGLGLYIVRAIARAHEGEVAVTSSAEQGTTFVLRLPRTVG
jgi:signal transduction histidine kinase